MPQPAILSRRPGADSQSSTARFHHGGTFQRSARVDSVRAAVDRLMIALYGGYATPSETAGLGGLPRFGADRSHLQRVAAFRPRADPEIDDPRFHPSDDDHRHVALYSLCDELSAQIRQSAAESIVAMHAPRWELLFAILVMVGRARLLPCRRSRSS